MKLTEMFPSRWLSADDIDAETRVTISKISFEKMQDNEGKEQDKPVLWFLRVDKGLVLNKTNGERIAEQHGDDTDGWLGKTIILTKEMVTAFGKSGWAIRVKPTPPPAKTNALAAAAKEPDTSEPPF